MFKLHGFAISNYYNIVKLTLLVKGLDFDEVPQPPSQDEEFLAKSPLGKIPVLQVREGYLTETAVIVDFLEDVYPEIALFPKDPFAKAEVKRLCHMAEIYLDLPFRPVVANMMGGAPLSEERKEESRRTLEKNAKGIARIASPSPWICGDTFSAADIFFYYCLSLVAPMAKTGLGFDIYSYLPGFDTWRDTMAQRDFVQQVDAAQKVAREKFMKSRNA